MFPFRESSAEFLVVFWFEWYKRNMGGNSIYISSAHAGRSPKNHSCILMHLLNLLHFYVSSSPFMISCSQNRKSAFFLHKELNFRAHKIFSLSALQISNWVIGFQPDEKSQLFYRYLWFVIHSHLAVPQHEIEIYRKWLHSSIVSAGQKLWHHNTKHCHFNQSLELVLNPSLF